MKLVKVILMMLCTSLCVMGCIKEKVEGADLKVGDVLPEFSVEMNDGSVVSDVTLRGNVSCLMFFHTTCPDCQKTLPVMQEIYDNFTGKGVSFALVSREQVADEIEFFWTENSLNMPYSAQKDRTIYYLFAQTRIPRVYICDKDGIIRHIFTDNPIPDYVSLENALNGLL